MEPFWNVLDENSEEEMQRVILLYGPSGVGKTRLLSQLRAGGKPPLILACDPGELGGATSGAQFKPYHIKIKSYDQLISLIPKIEKAVEEGEFKIIGVDSISYLSRTVLGDILDTVNREIPRYEEWNLLATRMRMIVEKLTDIPCHVVFTAIDDTKKDEITGAVLGGPNLPGKLAVELPQACDVVARLTVVSTPKAKGVREVTYSYTVVGDSIYNAKDRTGVIDPNSGVVDAEIFNALFDQNSNEEEVA